MVQESSLVPGLHNNGASYIRHSFLEFRSRLHSAGSKLVSATFYEASNTVARLDWDIWNRVFICSIPSAVTYFHVYLCLYFHI